MTSIIGAQDAAKAHNSRIDELARDLYAVFRDYVSTSDEVADAKGALDGANEQREGARMATIKKLADFSTAHKMTDDEIKRASVKAMTLHNNAATIKSLETFAAEVRVAMDPKVRDHAGTIANAMSASFQAEGELKKADKSSPTPLRKAFKREYHAILRAFKVCRDEGRVLHSESAIVAWAEFNDPDVDAGKAIKQLEGITERLDAIAANFPHDHLASIKGFLAEITKDGLIAAREGVIKAQEDVTASHVLAPVPVRATKTVEWAKAEPEAVNTVNVINPLEALDAAAGVAVDGLTNY